MPLIYRSMRKAEDRNRPEVLPGSNKGLGVRIADYPCVDGPHCRKDVHPDRERYVSPMANAHSSNKVEGMSVNRNWQDIPDYLIPKRLNHIVKGASGSNKAFCWQMGAGDFVPSKITDKLEFHPDPPSDRHANPIHGVVAPATKVHVDDYETHLAATVDAWHLIPEEQ